jgi:hypothetical protein
MPPIDRSPSSLDLRTRIDGTQPPVDPARFFEHELPALLDARSGVVLPGARLLAPAPLVVETAGESWTLGWTGARVQVRRGGRDGAAHIRLAPGQLDDIVSDQQTPTGFRSSGRLDQPAGTIADVLDWWLILRAALDDRPLHTPGAVTFRDRAGGSLDLRRTFRIDDPVEEMRHFLTEAGYLHIAAVFTADEMAAVSRDMDAAAPGYTPGDGRSWWAKTSDGERRLVRMQAFDERSEATAAIVRAPKFLGLGDVPGAGHVWGKRSFNRIEALFKPIGVVEGISDVPWHKDCALGRHSYDCCGVTVGISVTGADAGSGQLRVVAGSHRALVWPQGKQPGCDLPEIDLPTDTGDVTLHLSCTLHMAQPPIARERRVLYTGFGLPDRDTQAAAAGRARLAAVREAAPVTVSQPPADRPAR